eukprot:TRINITY_DN2451_c2_g2_i16.p2 TRINITY_DN2451_c2_g2~~TRINITY_DN2451_c2_g2_i16.p2  ORF type:complete len:136 (+),score=11.64 TRINITY_DN2451_c2_g2_i16:44-451(+)
MEPVEPTLFDFKKLQLIEESTTTLSNMQKQMAIWSSYVSYKTKNGEGDDPLTKLFGDLKEVTHSSNFDQEVVIDYPIALFFGQERFLINRKLVRVVEVLISSLYLLKINMQKLQVYLSVRAIKSIGNRSYIVNSL